MAEPAYVAQKHASVQPEAEWGNTFLWLHANTDPEDAEFTWAAVHQYKNILQTPAVLYSPMCHRGLEIPTSRHLGEAQGNGRWPYSVW